MTETQIRSLGQEDPLEEGMATHPSIFAFHVFPRDKENSIDRGAWRAVVHRVAELDTTDGS